MFRRLIRYTLRAPLRLALHGLDLYSGKARTRGQDYQDETRAPQNVAPPGGEAGYEGSLPHMGGDPRWAGGDGEGVMSGAHDDTSGETSFIHGSGSTDEGFVTALHLDDETTEALAAKERAAHRESMRRVEEEPLDLRESDPIWGKGPTPRPLVVGDRVHWPGDPGDVAVVVSILEDDEVGPRAVMEFLSSDGECETASAGTGRLMTLDDGPRFVVLLPPDGPPTWPEEVDERLAAEMGPTHDEVRAALHDRFGTGPEAPEPHVSASARPVSPTEEEPGENAEPSSSETLGQISIQSEAWPGWNEGGRFRVVRWEREADPSGLGVHNIARPMTGWLSKIVALAEEARLRAVVFAEERGTIGTGGPEAPPGPTLYDSVRVELADLILGGDGAGRMAGTRDRVLRGVLDLLAVSPVASPDVRDVSLLLTQRRQERAVMIGALRAAEEFLGDASIGPEGMTERDNARDAVLADVQAALGDL